MYTKSFTTTIIAALAALATHALGAPSAPSALDTRHLSSPDSSAQVLDVRQVYTGSCTATNCGASGTNCRASGKWCTPYPNSSAPQGCVCSSL